MPEVLKVSEKPGLGIEPALSYLPWVSRDEVSALEEKVSEVKESLNEVLGALASTDLRIKELENFKNSLENRITSLSKELDDAKAVLENVASIAFVSKLIGTWKGMTCSWVVENVCTAWKLSNEVASEIKEYFGDAALVKVNGDWRLAIKGVPHICAFCPLYKPKNGISAEDRKA